jgi:multiple sugar transport system permease protein
LSKPVVTTVAVFSIVHRWNDFMGPLIYLNSINKMTLAVGLQLFCNQYGGYWNLMMAAAVLMTVPMMLLFVVGQRYFVKGIVMTGITGR